MLQPGRGAGRGCDNSAATGGASLHALGSAALPNDTLSFTSSGQTPTASSILLQGDASSRWASWEPPGACAVSAAT
ncbi:MAG: hypothetical protein IPJ19_21025 [Planctomycetes bacterium]|nr:hypothetical protein [Planctomycetota bacterium]